MEDDASAALRGLCYDANHHDLLFSLANLDGKTESIPINFSEQNNFFLYQSAQVVCMLEGKHFMWNDFEKFHKYSENNLMNQVFVGI